MAEHMMPDIPNRVPAPSGARFVPEVTAADWDRFVEGAPGGRHVQLSTWAALKARDGWVAKRVGLARNGELVAGAQLLYRTLPVLGRIGYVPHGPLLSDLDRGPADQTVWAIVQEATDLGIRHLTVQPPPAGRLIEDSLRSFHFGPGEAVAPTATVLVDLTSDEEVLANMAPRTRYNARLGERRGLTFSEGQAGDLPLFHSLLRGTAARQGFNPPSLDYFRRMWDLFALRDEVRLFMVCREEEPVSTMLAIRCGDTLTNKMAVWSGDHGRDRPNEFLHWQVMRWAIAHGHTVYDFEGIPRAVADAVLAGSELPEKYSSSVASFKLGFGGRVVLAPEAMAWSPNRLLGSAYRLATSNPRGRKLARQVLNRLRTGRTPA